jgi:GTPase SAR1 family protein
MQARKIEIKVALLGHVSAGKSTVINALLQGKFAEVGMRRTTAGINSFRLHCKEKLEEDSVDGDTSPSGNERDDTMKELSLESEEYHTADSSFAHIVHDNSNLRETNEIQESSFDVELDEPLCTMHKHTSLVLIDIPGLNEAGSKSLYSNFVNDMWTTFDCVVAVMDVFQGVNTEEQVQLLQLIKDNVDSKKEIPVIVLCNKVDDLENEEVMMLVDEVRQKVDDIFGSKTSFPFVPDTTPLSPADPAYFYTPGKSRALVAWLLVSLDSQHRLPFASVHPYFGGKCIRLSNCLTLEL